MKEQEIKEWKLNTDRYLLGLYLLEKLYDERKIKRKKKKEIEEKLNFLFEKKYWELNPNLKNPLLLEVFTRMFKTFQIV